MKQTKSKCLERIFCNSRNSSVDEINPDVWASYLENRARDGPHHSNSGHL